MCLITSIVHPLPSILYCCVSEHSHLYHSGMVCNRAHSVGVRRRMRFLIIHAFCPSPSSRALAITVAPLLLRISRKLSPLNERKVPDTTIGTWPPPIPPAATSVVLLFSEIVTWVWEEEIHNKLFCSHEWVLKVGDLSVCSAPVLNPLGRW